MSARALIMLATLALGACASVAGPGPRSTEAAWSVPAWGSEREARGAAFSLVALVEARLGRRLDAGDRRLLEGAAVRALTAARTGARELWRNRQTGNAGEVALARHIPAGDGRLCRILQHDQTIEAARVRGTVTVCRRARSEWRVSEVRWWRLGGDFSGDFDVAPAAADQSAGNWRTIAD